MADRPHLQVVPDLSLVCEQLKGADGRPVINCHRRDLLAEIEMLREEIERLRGQIGRQR